MADGSDMQPGEIARSLTRIEATIEGLRGEVRDRHHELANQMTAQLGPISVHGVKIAALESQVAALDIKVEHVTAQANKVAGITGFLAVTGAWLVSWLRHP